MDNLIKDAYTERLLKSNEATLMAIGHLDPNSETYLKELIMVSKLLHETSEDYKNYSNNEATEGDLLERYAELDQRTAEAAIANTAKEKEMRLTLVTSIVSGLLGLLGLGVSLVTIFVPEIGLNRRFDVAAKREADGEPFLGFTERETVQDGLRQKERKSVFTMPWKR